MWNVRQWSVPCCLQPHSSLNLSPPLKRCVDANLRVICQQLLTVECYLQSALHAVSVFKPLFLTRCEKKLFLGKNHSENCGLHTKKQVKCVETDLKYLLRGCLWCSWRSWSRDVHCAVVTYVPVQSSNHDNVPFCCCDAVASVFVRFLRFGGRVIKRWSLCLKLKAQREVRWLTSVGDTLAQENSKNRWSSEAAARMEVASQRRCSSRGSKWTF